MRQIAAIALAIALAACADDAPSRPPPRTQQQQATTPRPPPRSQAKQDDDDDDEAHRVPKSPMVSQVAGFRFGLTQREAAEQCEHVGGIFVPTAMGGGCTQTAVRLEFPVSLVGFTLCDGRACEIALMIDAAPGPIPIASSDAKRRISERAERIPQIADLLVSKYGRPLMVDGDAGSPAELPARCLRTGRAQKRLIWAWYKEPLGRMLLTYKCDVRGDVYQDFLSIIYDDAAGLAWRMSEAKQRHENY